MPKAFQKRGKRMKRKHEDDTEDPELEESSKRRKSTDGEHAAESLPLHTEDGDMSTAYPPSEKVFFGMLDEDEQEYFKRADEMLELDSFATPEERSLFLERVWKEADGKELKIAHSQSCSRLLERLIANSTGSQLKNLYQKLSGNFIHLLSHRFASHCCETLFTYAAPFVSKEVLAASGADSKKADAEDMNEIYVSMENLFLHTLAELQGNIGFLFTDRYASHALRILLLVFAGKPISAESMKSLLQGKGKEGISGTPPSGKTELAPDDKDRPVPQSFSTALETLISDTVAGLDTDKLRALATHPNANPVLQLLLVLELNHYGKQRAKDESSIIRTLLPDDPLTADCQSAGFIGGMAYDPVGSHLVEKIIETAPGKMFKNLYNNYFKERMTTYAKNEVGTYIVCRIIERLGEDDLLEAHEILTPIIPTLLKKQWTSLTRTLMERCTVRQIDTQVIAIQIDQTYQGADGFDVVQMLKLNNTPDALNGENNNESGANAGPFIRVEESAKVHFNILGQAMLIVPGSLSALILDAVIALVPKTLVDMARDHIVTRTLQQCLTTRNASMIQRRKLVQGFYGQIGDMALHKSASHVVDCIWEGTHGLAFIRERIAEELAENETALRESPSGRAVWKNWKMDVYKRNRSEWIRQSKIKASNDGFQSFSEIDANKDGVKKTPLQMAQERHARKKAHDQKATRKSRKNTEGKMTNGNSATGANAVAPVVVAPTATASS